MLQANTHRLAALGVLALIVAAWLFVYIFPVSRSISLANTALRTEYVRLSRYEELTGQADEIRQQVNESRAVNLPTYKGQSPSSMRAALQRDIGSAARTSGVTVIALQPQNTERREQGFQHLELVVELSGGTNELRTFAMQLRELRPLVVVRRARIMALDPGTETRAAQLSMRFELLAFGEGAVN